MAIKTEELDQYVKLAAEGDKVSFEELYRRTYGTVYFTCLSFLKNEQDAQDTTQEVYVTVLDSLSTLKDHSKFLPWLNRIAVNKCKNRLKAVKAVPMDMEEENQPMEENENFLPEEYITNQAKRRIVMDIMKNRLTEAQYQTVIMFYFNEFTVQEISEIMECPIGTVTRRLSAAREKIRQGVSEYENTNHDKLYTYASAVPLLAGLLTAEASSLGNVQAAAADTASITKAASATNAANTLKGGTIKKMLKTPKIMIAASAAAVVIIGGIAAAVIATNHENAPEDGAQTRQEGQQASYDTETDREQEDQQASYDAEADQDNPQASSDTNEYVFWLHTADWGEEKDLTGITLFNGECTAPISLDDFDGDEHLGPYCITLKTGSGYSFADSYNLTELLTDEIAFSKEDIDIRPQRVYEDGYVIVDHGKEAAIHYITLKNIEDEDMPLRQIYENNWFYIYANNNFLMEFSSDELELTEEEYYTDYAHVQLEAIIDKYGRPSYLLIYDRNSFLENYESNRDYIVYILVWEKEDFVITLEVCEAIFNDTTGYCRQAEHLLYSGIDYDYGMVIDNSGISSSFRYITRDIWDYYKDHNFYNYDIYDLDDLK